MQMDAETVIVAPAWPRSTSIATASASAVGRLSVRAFGDASPAADQVAHHLGRALQLTNILRDLEEDAERGRLYLPRECSTRQACRTIRPRRCAARGSDRSAAAWPRSRMGISAPPTPRWRRCDRRAMRPARLMGATYAAILARLERRGWRASGRAA